MIEYAIVLAAVISALLGMQHIMKAHIAGGWRDAVDSIGHGHLYEDASTTSVSYSVGDQVQTLCDGAACACRRGAGPCEPTGAGFVQLHRTQ